MRPEPNNDIDLLLRQLSRRNGAPVSEADELHLDADELNSYVANALPAVTRARYTTHLADCSSCRKLVVELSAAQGPVPRQPTATAVAPSGLMSFLASLFSPMVLRYAVPALGLMVIAVIGIVVLRQESGRSSVARLNDSNQAQPAVTTSPQEPSTSGYTSTDGDSAAKTAEQKPLVAPIGKEDSVAKVAPVTKASSPAVANQPAGAAGAVAGEAPPSAPKVAQAEDASGRADLNKDKKAEPFAARDAVKERATEADKNESPKTESQVVITPGSTIRRDIGVRSAKSGDSATATAGTGAGHMKRAPAARSQSREEAKDTEAAAETRSVAGRRFRKSGRVWIDTDYDSSKPIMTVARGSEQYRVLVADEPSIRTIADQLDGEIVVVWKGRNYRIR